MNESAEKDKVVAKETEEKDRELSDKEVDEAKVSGGTDSSIADTGRAQGQRWGHRI